MKKIFVAGHRGMVGGAICRLLEKEPFNHLVTRTHSELDLCDQSAVHEFFESEKPNEVILAAAKLGGFMQITLIQPSLFIRTFKYKIM